ncbi:cell envelope integrity protein TolA [Bacteroides sp.]|uniref:cell envelope integrity protein TolA n=1 Tax=Bacteroides sp. TaxID=29523 RepID=UPI001B50A4FA|nr:cell envelope integrity protein TolA [Bacteroides sp.]MBP6937294.1 cell envelope integrity protein TolA [Bacteroides sp.]
MDRKKKGEYIGMLGALLVHVIFFALLILVTIAVSLPKEDDGGVPVMMGNTDAARGDADPSLVEVDVLPAPPEPLAEAQPEEIAEQELMSQTEEETIIVKPKVTPKKEKPKVVKKTEVKKPEVVKKPEKTAAEKATEARLLAEAKAEQERKSAEDAARKRVSGAFGKGAQMNGSKGTADSGTGVEGSRDGNSSTGAKTGVGGYGTFNLGGRSIGEGGLPRPAYNVQEEGRVVVSITVNPAGQVIATSINRQTNTVNATLRKAAEDAAKKARFNSVDGINNQTGTITYYFNLR